MILAIVVAKGAIGNTFAEHLLLIQCTRQTQAFSQAPLMSSLMTERRFSLLRRIHDVLCGLEGVVNIADDIVIGQGTSLKEATHDHDRTVIELLDRLSQHLIKLNPDKVKFKTCSVPFMGYILTPEGPKPSNEIVNAQSHEIVNAGRPGGGARWGTCIWSV